MIIKLTSIKKTIYVLCIGIVLLSCSKNEDDKRIDARLSPVGKYTLRAVSGTTTDCDLLSTIEFKANNTIEFIHYISDDDDCSDFELITGTWSRVNTFAGSFRGDLTLNSTFNGQSTSDGSYSSTLYASIPGEINLRIFFILQSDNDEDNVGYSIDFRPL
jgi:hypothetical protein